MTKSELIAALAKRHQHLLSTDVDLPTRHVLGQLTDALARGERIEVRGFGSFTLRYRRPRLGRNPKTGSVVALRATYLPHFKPGIQLRGRLNGLLFD
jgi:integration host factor subunit beta